jgi:hypothetical protein
MPPGYRPRHRACGVPTPLRLTLIRGHSEATLVVFGDCQGQLSRLSTSVAGNCWHFGEARACAIPAYCCAAWASTGGRPTRFSALLGSHHAVAWVGRIRVDRYLEGAEPASEELLDLLDLLDLTSGDRVIVEIVHVGRVLAGPRRRRPCGHCLPPRSPLLLARLEGAGQRTAAKLLSSAWDTVARECAFKPHAPSVPCRDLSVRQLMDAVDRPASAHVPLGCF